MRFGAQYAFDLGTPAASRSAARPATSRAPRWRSTIPSSLHQLRSRGRHHRESMACSRRAIGSHDARIVYETADKHFALGLYGNNLSDKRYKTDAPGILLGRQYPHRLLRRAADRSRCASRPLLSGRSRARPLHAWLCRTALDVARRADALRPRLCRRGRGGAAAGHLPSRPDPQLEGFRGSRAADRRPWAAGSSSPTCAAAASPTAIPNPPITSPKIYARDVRRDDGRAGHPAGRLPRHVDGRDHHHDAGRRPPEGSSPPPSSTTSARQSRPKAWRGS